MGWGGVDDTALLVSPAIARSRICNSVRSNQADVSFAAC